jgi:hypothetical protein
MSGAGTNRGATNRGLNAGAGMNRGANAGAGSTNGASMGASRGQADGQWHSFGAPVGSSATMGNSVTGTMRGEGQPSSANSEGRGANVSGFSGNRTGAAGRPPVRSWSGEGHNIVENTARPASSSAAVSRATAGSGGSARLGAFTGSSAFVAGTSVSGASMSGRAAARPLPGTVITSNFGVAGISGVNAFHAPGFIGNRWNGFRGGSNFPGRFGGTFGVGLGFRGPFRPFRFGELGAFGLSGFRFGFGLGWGLGWPGCGWDWPYGFCGPFGYGGFWGSSAYGYPGYGYGYDDGYYGGNAGLSYDSGGGYGSGSGNPDYGNPDYGNPNYYNNGGNPDSNAGAPSNSAKSSNNSSNAVPSGTSPSTPATNPDNRLNAPAANQTSGTVVTLYFKDGTEFVARDYWFASDKLHYVGSDGVEMTVDFDQLNLQKTIDENAKGGVQFSLKSSPAGSAAPASPPGAPGGQSTPGNGAAPNAGNEGQPQAAKRDGL